MTVEVTEVISATYFPNGTTTTFDFDFKAASLSELLVLAADGTVVSSSLYTVSLNAGEGGTVTFSDAPLAADYPDGIYIASNPDFEQNTQISNTGPGFDPSAIEASLDEAATRDLWLRNLADHALRVPDKDIIPELPNDTARASKFLAFDASGDPIAADGTSIADAQLTSYTASGTGAVARTIAAVIGEHLISIKDYGALGDNVADDTTAIKSAIQAADNAGGGTVFFPPGIYKHTGISLTGIRFVRLCGVPMGSHSTAGTDGTRLVCTSTTAHQIELIDPFGVVINDLNIMVDSTLTPTAGQSIRLYTASGGSASCVIDRVRIENHYDGIGIDGVSNSFVSDSQIRQGKGTFGLKVLGTAKRIDQIRLKDIIIDTEVSGGSTTYDGFVFDTDSHTVWADRCSALQCKYGWHLAGATPPEFATLQNCEAENSNSHGALIDAADHLRMNGGYYTQNGGAGILFGSGHATTADLDRVGARVNQYSGIQIENSGRIEIVAPRIGGNSQAGSGLHPGINVFPGVSNWGVIGGKIGGDHMLSGTGLQSYGVSINTGSSDNYRVLGIDGSGNVSGNIADGGTGTNKALANNL